MDFSKAFVASLCAGGKDAYKKMVTRGIHSDYLEGEGKFALSYVIDHVTNFSDVPSREIVLGKTGIDVGEPDGTFDFYVEECLNMNLFKMLKSGLQPIPNLLNEYKPKEAVAKLKELLKAIDLAHITHKPAQSIFSHVPEVLKIYEDMKAGKRGIPLPFPTMNNYTLGMWPQDLILFVARIAQGKSWTMLLVARTAWKAGYRVLLCTTEMSQVRIAQRFFAMEQKLPYSGFRSGTLPPMIESSMYENLKEMMSADDGRFKVIGGDFDFNFENLESEIADFIPDLVIIDGAYLIKSDGDSRTDKAANTFNMLKRLANKVGIPVVVSSQFNRDVKKNSPNTVQAENIGLTDVAGWNADVAIALVQTEDMYQDRRLIYKFLKFREGKGDDIEVIWDIENMYFEEVAGLPELDNPFNNVAPATATISNKDPF